jgi:ADP-ribosylglycohydrolase
MTFGSILGAYSGPEGLEARWLAPFNDDIHTALAQFYERSLSKWSIAVAAATLAA